MYKKAEALIDWLLAHPEDGRAANELLSRLHRGEAPLRIVLDWSEPITSRSRASGRVPGLRVGGGSAAQFMIACELFSRMRRAGCAST